MGGDASLSSPFPSASWEQYVQDYDPAQIGIVDPEAAASFTNQDLISCVLERREESRRARAILEQDWDRYEAKYYLWDEPSDKEDWQPDLIVPEVLTKIRTARSLLQGALGDPERFFTVVKLQSLTDDHQIRFIRDWIHYTQRNAHLLDGLLDVWEEALLFGAGVLKITIEDEIKTTPRVEMRPIYPPEIQQAILMQAQMTGMPPPPLMEPVVLARPEPRQRVSVRKVPLRHAYPDPAAPSGDFYQGKFFVEDMLVFEEDLHERLAAGVYDSLEDIGEPARMKESGVSETIRKSLTGDQLTSRRQHLVTEYTGNIYAADGRCVAKNWIVTVVNERAVVRARPNPMWSGKTRYVWSTPIPFPGRVWGRPLVEADVDIQDALSSLLNLMLMDVSYSVLGAFAVDENAVDPIEDLESIEPGRVYRGRGDFIQKLNFPSNVNAAWPMMQFLQGIGDKSTAINEFVQGTPTSRGRPSATEVASKTQAGTAYMHNLARRLEENDVERSLELVYEYLLQFGGDTSEPALKDLIEAWGGPQALMDERSRLAILSAPHKIQVRGISMLLSREQTIARLKELLGVFAQLGIPPKNQLQIAYIFMSALGFSPEQLGFQPTWEEEQALQQWMMMQQMAGGGGGVGGGVGSLPGTAPESSLPGGAPPSSPDNRMLQMEQQAQASPMGGGA